MKRLTEDQKKIVEENLPLAYTIAKGMRNDALPDDDKRQAGAIGLIEAVASFDVAKGAIGTRSHKYVRNSVVAAEMREYVIYVPRRVFHKKRDAGPEREKELLGLAMKSRRMSRIGGSADRFRRAEDVLSRNSEDPAKAAEYTEWLESLKAGVRDAMAELKPKQRAAIEGFLADEEHAVTAARLGCSRQNIAELKKSAFAKIRKRLSRYVA